MPVIVPAGQLNVAALTADDLYIQILNPPGYIQGVPTDVFGVVGGASWGPVNQAVHMGSPQEAALVWGPISAVSLTDPFDMPTDLALAFGQARSEASIEGWGVRVSDGTDTAATSVLAGAASHVAETATIGGTVTPADVLSVTGASGIVFTASYTVKPSGETLATLAAGLAAACNANVAFKAGNGFAIAVGAVISLYVPTGTTVTWSQNVVGSTATCTATLAGSPYTAADTIALTFTNASIGSFPITKTYTLGSSETAATAAAGLVALINGDATLLAAGVSANNLAGVITINQQNEFANSTVVTRTVSGSETVTFAPSNGHLGGGPTETITLATGSASSAGGTLRGIFTGVIGNGLQANISLGSGSATSTVILSSVLGTSEIYPNLPNVGFWGALQTAINFGLSGVRGPSQICRMSGANNGVGAPTVGAYTFSGGTDGRIGLTTGLLLGTDSNPGTGLYALRQLNPAVGQVWIAGLIDSNAWASALAFAQSEGCSYLAPFAAGTTTAAALAAVQTNGIHDPSFVYLKDWIYFFDPINNQTRLVAPTPVIAGTITTYAPQISPSNKPVSLVIGTERFNPWTGNQPYTTSEVGQLESAGIMFVTNPVPGGSYWGIRHGQTTSLLPVTQPFEWWRLTSYLARSFAATMGQFVGQNQSTQPNDPTRAAVRNQLNGFLQFLASPAAGTGDGIGQIDSYQVICSYNAQQGALPGLGVNTADSVARHYLFAMVKIKYLSSIRFFVLSLQGGTTVVTVGSGPGQNLTQQAA